MKCVNWKKCHNKAGSAQHKLCWKKWRMCGECAVLEHPEAYKPSYVKQMHTRLAGKGRVWWNE
jgi:hypothetical protein